MASLAPAQVTREDLVAAEAFATAFASGRTTDARAYFSPALESRFTDAEMGNLLDSMGEAGGELRHVQAAISLARGTDLEQAAVPLIHDRGSFLLILRWRGDLGPGALEELIAVPRRAGQREPVRSYPIEYRDPAYVDRQEFQEREIRLLAFPTELKASLSLPRQADERPVPAVVLLPEPFAADENGSIGPNRPWQNIADGLASHGVAVLRYAPRYLNEVGPGRPATLEAAWLSDARTAVRTLAAQRGIDKARIYLVGHDTSAFLAPLVLQAFPAVRGTFLISPPARITPITAAAREAAWLEAIGAQNRVEPLFREAELVQQGRAEDTAEFLGVPLPFWEDVVAVRPERLLARDKRRLWLILPQEVMPGEIGQQRQWAEWAESRQGLQLVTPAGLNHWLMEQDQKVTALDYQMPRHVSERGIAIILRAIAEDSRLPAAIIKERARPLR